MWQALEVAMVGGRFAMVGLVAFGGAFAPLVGGVRRKLVAKRPEHVEVAPLEVNGARVGAVYEDGKLVGVLEGVDRV